MEEEAACDNVAMICVGYLSLPVCENASCQRQEEPLASSVGLTHTHNAVLSHAHRSFFIQSQCLFLSISIPSTHTRDECLHGAIHCRQPKIGMHVTLDRDC